ncbi:hypothetical protein ASE99_08145 [Serratia sp. Leaf51]|nr:hypothetical protein ASE99_08145 [Serratia sp. Leaf51]
MLALIKFREKNFVVTWGRKIIEKSPAKIEPFFDKKEDFPQGRLKVRYAGCTGSFISQIEQKIIS